MFSLILSLNAMYCCQRRICSEGGFEFSVSYSISLFLYFLTRPIISIREYLVGPSVTLL